MQTHEEEKNAGEEGWYISMLTKRAEDDDKSSFCFFFLFSPLSLSSVRYLLHSDVVYPSLSLSLFIFSLERTEEKKTKYLLMSWRMYQSTCEM